MNLLFRLAHVVVVGGLGQPLGFLDVSVLRFWVWPNDLDLNGHMNNGRYLSLMDLGRIDLTLRCGWGRILVRRRWRPLIGAATIRFRRSLTPFQRYELHTRLLGWDEKWLYFEQEFRCAGELAARATVQALLRGKGGNVPSREVIEALGAPRASPELPQSVLLWIEAERQAARPRLETA